MAGGGCNYGTKRRLGLSVYYMIGQGTRAIFWIPDALGAPHARHDFADVTKVGYILTA